MPYKEDTSPLVPKEEKNCIQQIVVTSIYYARTVEITIMVSLVSIALNQAKSNETTSQAIKKMLDYCDTHPYATIRYNQSYMLIRVQSNG